MKTIIYILATLLMFFSCSAKQKIAFEQEKDCTVKIDSLSRVLKHVKFGVYSVRFDFFSIRKYDDLSILELAKMNIPIEKSEQLIFEFENFVKEFSSIKDCNCNLTKSIFRKKVGIPFTETYNGAYVYKMNYGSNCPCNDCPIPRIFDGCTAFDVFFDENECFEKVRFRY